MKQPIKYFFAQKYFQLYIQKSYSTRACYLPFLFMNQKLLYILHVFADDVQRQDVQQEIITGCATGDRTGLETAKKI